MISRDDEPRWVHLGAAGSLERTIKLYQQAQAGEGVLGLRRGFVQAGAQNLLLTLWPIDDQRTRSLMSDFYTRLQKSRSPAHALAEVQRNWLKSLRAEKGIAEACRIAGPFILSFQGRPEDE